MVSSTKERTTLLTVLMLLGSYAFGFNLHSVIHEFGHAVAIWVQGGQITGFYFHPFGSCLNFSTYVPNHILLYAGGAYIGGASTIVFVFIAWKYRTPFMLPLVFVCSAGLITTSRWMLIAPFSDIFTDYSSMISLGVPGILIALTGIVYLITGIGVLILYLPLAGLGQDTGILRRILILEAGILPYRIVTGIHEVARGVPPAVSLTVAAAASVFLALTAALSKWIPERIRFFRSVELAEVKPVHVTITWAATAVLIIVMFLFSSEPVAAT